MREFQTQLLHYFSKNDNKSNHHRTGTHYTILQHNAPQCNTMQHNAPHCNTLKHTATQCNTLHHTAPHCTTLHHTAPHCTTLHHTAPHCTTLQHTATHCYTLLHTAPYCNALQHTATHCNTLSIHAFMCVRSWQALTHSYVWYQLCDMTSTHSFICVTWHSLIHMCDMTHSQRRERLIYMTWRPKIFSGAFCFVLNYISKHQKDVQKKTLPIYECAMAQIWMSNLTYVNE